MLTQVEQIIYEEAVEKNIISTIQMCKKFGIGKLSVLKELPERFSISEMKAHDYIEAYWE